MDKKLFGKPERNYKNYLSTRIEPTILKPYILDYVKFCIANNEKIMAFYDNDKNSLIELLSDTVINDTKIEKSPELKISYGFDIKDIKLLDEFEMKDLLKQSGIKSLIGNRFYLRLKECTNGGYIESSWAPSINMRASKNQIVSIAKDLQRGYNKKLSKQNKSDKKHENEIEPEM